MLCLNFFRYDYLRLYDGDSNGSPMLGQYSGTSIPPSHISSSNKIFIHFQSDGDTTRTGFKLEYHPSGKTYCNIIHLTILIKA